MSKVVHLSNDAHAVAKKHCQAAGMKMSEWVAALIAHATRPAVAPPKQASAGRTTAQRAPAQPRPVAGPVERKRPLPFDAPSADAEGDLMLYAAPPFWAPNASSNAANP